MHLITSRCISGAPPTAARVIETWLTLVPQLMLSRDPRRRTVGAPPPRGPSTSPSPLRELRISSMATSRSRRTPTGPLRTVANRCEPLRIVTALRTVVGCSGYHDAELSITASRTARLSPQLYHGRVVQPVRYSLLHRLLCRHHQCQPSLRHSRWRQRVAVRLPCAAHPRRQPRQSELFRPVRFAAPRAIPVTTAHLIVCSQQELPARRATHLKARRNLT